MPKTRAKAKPKSDMRLNPVTRRRPSQQQPAAVQIETFGLDPDQVARYAIRQRRELSSVELANVFRGIVIAARMHHDEGDDEKHVAALVRMQVIVAEMVWRIDPRAPDEPEFRHQIESVVTH